MVTLTGTSDNHASMLLMRQPGISVHFWKLFYANCVVMLLPNSKSFSFHNNTVQAAAFNN